MPIAGPVFPEWYWGPIFLLIAAAPVVTVVAVLLYLVMRRRGWGSRPVAAIASLVLAGSVMVGGFYAWEWVRFERDARREAKMLDFRPWEPRRALGLFEATRAQAVVVPTRAPSLDATYRLGDAVLFVTQQRLPELRFDPPTRCWLPRVEGIPSKNFYDGPCELRRTARGRTVLLGRDPEPPGYRHAFATLERTLIVISSLRATDEALLVYVDALEPVDAADVDLRR